MKKNGFNILKKIIFSLIYFCYVSTCFAVVSNGYHTDQDYIDLANSDVRFNAIGFIYNEKKGSTFTGTLIQNDPKPIVITCMHGLEDYIPDNYDISKPEPILVDGLYMGFASGVHLFTQYLYKVKSITLNNSYVTQYRSNSKTKYKYDVAFLELETLPNIEPIALLDESHSGKPSVGAFLGYGKGIKKAAILPNLKIYEFSNTCVPMVTSLFGKPNLDVKPDYSLFGDENYNFFKQWEKIGLKPYAMGEHGDSGGPLLIKSNTDQLYIIGVVSGGGAYKTDADDKPTLNPVDSSKCSLDDLYNKAISAFATIFDSTYCGIMPNESIENMFKIAKGEKLLYSKNSVDLIPSDDSNCCLSKHILEPSAALDTERPVTLTIRTVGNPLMLDCIDSLQEKNVELIKDNETNYYALTGKLDDILSIMHLFCFKVGAISHEILVGGIKGFSKETNKEVYEDMYITINIK